VGCDVEEVGDVGPGVGVVEQAAIAAVITATHSVRTGERRRSFSGR